MADSVTILPNTKNDLIISLVQKELIERAVALPYLRNVSQYAVKGAKSIEVPKLSSMIVDNRAFGNAGDAQTLTDASDTILLNDNLYAAWLVDYSSAYQSTIDYDIEMLQRAARGHAKKVDELAFTGMAAVAGTEASGAALTQDIILDFREAILRANGDLSQTVMFVDPTQEKEMLKISDFVRADAYGNSNIPDGVIGRVYGVNVIVSNIVEGAIMIERDGFGFAQQLEPSFSEQMANEYGSKTMRKVLDQLIGFGGLELGEQGAAADKSPLVCSFTVA